MGNAINVVIVGTDPAPSPSIPSPRTNVIRLHSVRSMQQQRAAAVSQKFCQPVGTIVFTLVMEKKDLLGSALPPFSLRGGRCEEDAEKASKSHEKTSEDPTTFTLALSSEWVLFSPFIRGAIHILEGTDLSLSLPRPNRDQKADGVFPSL